jgi:hypothetical protein
MKRFTSERELTVPPTGGKLVLRGLDHGGPSYEARVYVGNPGADADTPRTPAHGYLGSVHVFGERRGVALPTDRELVVTPSANTRTGAITVVAMPVGAWPGEHAWLDGVELRG